MGKKPITEVVEEKIAESAVPVVEEPKPAPKKYVGVATERVNLRSESSIDSKIVTIVEKNETVNLIAKKPVNGFYKVEGGFIMKEYLEIKEA